MKAAHLGMAILCCAGLGAGAHVALNAQEPAPRVTPPSAERGEQGEAAKFRLREGTTLVDEIGRFRPDGDGAIFLAQAGHELIALPNLNLERVVRTLKGSDEAESIRWSVNGTVTEFNGKNYLLLKRAVYRSSSPPPLPEQILN